MQFFLEVERVSSIFQCNKDFFSWGSKKLKDFAAMLLFFLNACVFQE